MGWTNVNRLQTIGFDPQHDICLFGWDGFNYIRPGLIHLFGIELFVRPNGYRETYAAILSKPEYHLGYNTEWQILINTLEEPLNSIVSIESIQRCIQNVQRRGSKGNAVDFYMYNIKCVEDFIAKNFAICC